MGRIVNAEPGSFARVKDAEMTGSRGAGFAAIQIDEKLYGLRNIRDEIEYPRVIKLATICDIFRCCCNWTAYAFSNDLSEKALMQAATETSKASAHDIIVSTS